MKCQQGCKDHRGEMRCKLEQGHGGQCELERIADIKAALAYAVGTLAAAGLDYAVTETMRLAGKDALADEHGKVG